MKNSNIVRTSMPIQFRAKFQKQLVDLGQVFRHIFPRIYMFFSSFALGVVINIKENL